MERGFIDIDQFRVVGHPPLMNLSLKVTPWRHCAEVGTMSDKGSPP
jgi:hypothetical protein